MIKSIIYMSKDLSSTTLRNTLFIIEQSRCGKPQHLETAQFGRALNAGIVREDVDAQA
jgi:hypothetical protein